MKNLLLLLLTPLLLANCDKEIRSKMPKFASARSTDILWIIPGSIIEGEKIIYNNGHLKAEHFSLGFFTSDFPISPEDSLLNTDSPLYFSRPPFYSQFIRNIPSIPAIEKLIGPYRGNPQEYRIEQLESITITADQILWGQSIGSDLSSFFEVCEYDYIFMVKDNGYDLFPRNKKPVFPLHHLNEIKVMVPAELYIRFKTLPTERPGNIRFKVIYKIENGKQIEQISRPVTII